MAIRMTEVEAVNLALESVFQSPVNSLEPALGDVYIAREELTRTNTEFLSKGWIFNTDEQVQLAIDANGNIPIPTTAISVSSYDPTRQLISKLYESQDLLYDVQERSYIFTDTPELNIIWFIEFEELPYNAQRIVAMKAARRFGNKILGDSASYSFTKEDEQEAMLTFSKTENRMANRNMLTGDPTMFQIISRR